MRRRTTGLAIAAVGVGVLAISIVASMTHSSSDSSTASPTSTGLTTTTLTDTTTTIAPTPVPATTPSTVAATTVPSPPTSGDAEAFFAGWAAQVTAGDVEALVASLHPAVIDLYGREQCAATLATVAGQAVEVEVESLSAATPNTIELDGVVLVVEGLTVVRLYRSDIDQTVDARIAALDGAITWFTDCGSPEAS